MDFTHFMGIDVSKNTLDICLRNRSEQLFSCTINNDSKAVYKLVKKLEREFAIDRAGLIVCLEHTGIYSALVLTALYDLNVTTWLEDALQIKQVMRSQRGKTDQLDARSIMEYCYRFVDRVTAWEPERTCIKHLRKLLAHRKRLLEVRKMLTVPQQESAKFEEKELVNLQQQLNEPMLNQLERSLEAVERQIDKLIAEDEKLRQQYKLVTSVYGIGKVAGTYLLVCTNEFKRFSSGKKLACHAGVVPFDHRSGVSVRGRASISHRANKTLKHVLHMAAVVVISRPGELRDYYLRKIAEGKNKMSVINAVRNKLLLRVYACVRDNRLYQKNMQQMLV